MMTQQRLIQLSVSILTCQFVMIPSWLGAQEAAEKSQPAKASTQQDETGFKPLFDGKSFEGWEGNMKFFRIEQAAIVAGNLNEKIPNNEFLCTKQRYENFELRLDAKLIGQGDNAGVQFRSERIPNHHEVIGCQCDIGLIGKDRSIWGALYDESRRKKFLAETPVDSFKQIQQGDWNQLRIIANGNQIQIYVNGAKTVDYTEDDKQIAKSGIIGLQIHSGPPAEAWYRNIRIKPL